VLLTSVIGVVVLLGGLIFFHEFGHYIVAKFFGVRVEVFSLGFGKKLLRRRIGETEYCISVFPLGGYVKLMGDDPYRGIPAEDAHRAFATQKLYKRFAIVAAGPLFNLFLAFALFVAVFWFGQPVPSTRIGNVIEQSVGWMAGLRPKDRVVAVDDRPVGTWEALMEAFRGREGQTVKLRVVRGAAELELPITLGVVRVKNAYGEDEKVAGIPGVSSEPLLPVLGITDPKKPAAAAGLRSGDWVTKVGTTAVADFPELEEALAAAWQDGKPLVITAKRKPTADAKDYGAEKSFTVVVPTKPADMPYNGHAALLGIAPYDLFVYRVTKDSPADKAGLKPNDRLQSIDGKVLTSFDALVEAVERAGVEKRAVNLVVLRDGVELPLSMQPEETTQEDPFTRNKVKRHLIGVVSGLAAASGPPEMTKLIYRNPEELVAKAAQETYDLAHKMVVSLGKLVVGKLSVKNLGGPVLIASVAGKSLDAGIIPFLQMMALISINLFLLNLFPVPILDGGHLLFFTIEAIQGKPVSLRTMEIANQVGMVFILMLVGLTFFNDISRIVLH
jgi:regulator of sigma E protease